MEYLAGGSGSGGAVEGERCGDTGCAAADALRYGSEGVQAKAALGRFAAGGAEFLLLQGHFEGWAAAAHTGAFQANPYHTHLYP
jgi:hypothetical protein